jgi:hypothetical protein
MVTVASEIAKIRYRQPPQTPRFPTPVRRRGTQPQASDVIIRRVQRLTHRPRDWTAPTALFAFAALSLLFFWRLWALNPADRMTIGQPAGDFLRQFYPYRVFVARAWATLQAPLWNPHQYGGTPAWADPQLAVLYPWRWLQAPLAWGGRVLPLWAVHLEAVAHVALGGWFTFLLVRRLGGSPAAAALGGTAFAFGGYLTGYPLEQLAIVDTAVWIPATLWALTAATDAVASGDRRSARRWAVGAGVLTALAVLAGHPQTALYAFYAGAAWLAWRAWLLRAARRGILGVAGVWLALAVGLSAAQWWPSASFLARSARHFDFVALAAGFAWRDVLQVVAPLAEAVGQGSAPPWQWSPLYVGIVPLVLALWGLARAPAARPWLALAALAWLTALGGHGPLYPLLFRLAPGFALFRDQERIAVLVSLGLAVAAGLALDVLRADPTHSAPRAARAALVLAGGTGAAAALAVAGPADGLLAPFSGTLAFSALIAGLAAVALWAWGSSGLTTRQACLVLVALTLFDLFSVNRNRALAPGGNPFVPDPLTQALAPHARDGRVSSEGGLPGGPNAASVFGLFDTVGDSPLQLAATDALIHDAPELVWWRLLGVRYVITGRTFPAAAPVTELVRTGDRALYEVKLPVPPAWVPARVTTASWPWRPAPDFDPLAQAVVPNEAGVPDLATGVGGTATLTGLAIDRVAVSATLPGPGLVVASVPYDAGWQAVARSPGGAEVRPAVVPAYGALLGVSLPAGAWAVEWTYRPKGVLFGLALSLFAVLVGAGMWLWPSVRRT